MVNTSASQEIKVSILIKTFAVWIFSYFSYPWVFSGYSSLLPHFPKQTGEANWKLYIRDSWGGGAEGIGVTFKSFFKNGDLLADNLKLDNCWKSAIFNIMRNAEGKFMKQLF